MTEPLYDEKHLAGVLRTTENWVIRHRAGIPHTRVGRYYRWTPQDIEDVIAHFRRRPQDPSATRPISGQRRRSA